MSNRFKKSSGVTIRKAFYLISSYRKFSHSYAFQIKTGRGSNWLFPAKNINQWDALPRENARLLKIKKKKWNKIHKQSITPSKAFKRIKRKWHAYYLASSTNKEAHSVFDNNFWEIPDSMSEPGWKVTKHITTFPVRFVGEPKNQRIFSTPIPNATKKLFFRIKSNMPYAEDWQKTIIFE